MCSMRYLPQDVAISSNALPPKHAASEPKPQQDTQVHALLHPEPTGAIHASRQTGLPDRTLEVQEVARPCVEPCQTPPMVPESTISQHTPNGLVSATTIPQPQESTAHGDRMEGKPADVNSTLISVPVTSAVPAPQTVVPPASTSPVTLFVPDPQTQCTSKNVAPAPVPAPRPQPQTVLADGRRTRGAVQQKQAPAAQKQVVLRPVVSQSAQQRARFGPPKQMKTRPTVAKLAITRLVKNSVQASLLMTRPEFPKPPFSQILGFMHADRIAQLRTAEKAVWNATPRAPVPNKVPTPPVYRSKSSQQVVVRGLHHAVSSEDLKVALSFGSIESVKIEACGDTTTVTARILFTNCGDAKRAVNEMNADGKRLQATLAQPDIIGSASHRPPFRPKVVAPLNYRRLLPRPSKPLAPPPPRMNLLDGPIPKAALQPVPQPHAAVSKWQQFAAETAPEVHPALANEPVGDGNLHRNGENFRPTRNWETRMPGPGIPDRSFNRHWPSEMVRNTFNPMIRNAPTIRADCSNSTPHSSLPVRRLDKPAGRNNPT
ncbi:hypothetical protein DFJ77DRAFT_88289 [Powellomyces hirtus]|nr:hypothetical protein DFJ77DRAFT_88289 [Powellomyces hirtus]